jgi:hypothetical protein
MEACELNWALNLQRRCRSPRRVHLMLLDDAPLPAELQSVLQSVLHAACNDRDTRLSSFYRILDEESPI